MARRSRQALEKAIAAAANDRAQVMAHYDLAVFHDNNSREAEAIPNHEAALALGLDAATQAECLAWLASSLYKLAKRRRCSWAHLR